MMKLSIAIADGRNLAIFGLKPVNKLINKQADFGRI